MIKLKGIPASRGIGIAKAVIVFPEEIIVPRRKISYDEISKEIYKLEEALIATRKEIISLKDRINKQLGFEQARIFEAHILVLEDRLLIEDVILRIKKERVNVEYAFNESIKKYIDVLSKIDDDYLRERAFDIKDIAKRVLKQLLKQDKKVLYNFKEKVVIVAHDLSPSDTINISKRNIAGVITDIGGNTSHTAILASSMGIPAVVGTGNATKNIKEGDYIIVDGINGIVIVNPTELTIKEYQKKQRELIRLNRAVVSIRDMKAETKDGRRVVISANLEIPEEIPLIKQFGAEGVGLYRTEYLFLGKDVLPTEDEQFEAYLKIAKEVAPYSVIIRTIDIGGDKFSSHPNIPKELNPFLGCRAIRFCLANPHIFKTQLRAILRAAAEGDVKVMFPMISSIEEIKATKRIVAECKKELEHEKEKFNPNIEIGAMIETPSAALISDFLAKEVDFFSIGTNDLIQYSLAVDRTNEKVADLYVPDHPAVLMLIKNIVDNAHKNNIWVGMCGEMAGNLLFSVLLVGLGLDELSMPPPVIPFVKEVIREIEFKMAQDLVIKILGMSSSKEVDSYLKTKLKKIFKDKFEKFIKIL